MPVAPGKQPLMRFGFPTGGSDPVSKQNCVVRDELALHMTKCLRYAKKRRRMRALNATLSFFPLNAALSFFTQSHEYCFLLVYFTVQWLLLWHSLLAVHWETRRSNIAPVRVPGASRPRPAESLTASKQQERSLCQEHQDTRDKEQRAQ